MSDLLDLSATEARAALDTKSISATELTSAYINAAEQTAALNNYVLLTPEHALDMAARADQRLAKGDAGLLEGIPVGVKDLFCTTGLRQQPVRGFYRGLSHLTKTP